MDGTLAILPDLEIPLTEIELRVSRSSGPGGQHANVTDSRVEAVFEIDTSEAISEGDRERLRARFGGRVTAVSQDERSQARNRERALERLAERIGEALAPQKPRRPTRPSKASKQRRLETKRRRSETKRTRRPPDIGER